MNIHELSGNIKISEFIGPSKKFHDSRKGHIILYCKYNSPDNPNCEDYELDYNSSWDWLIPACKKFSSLNIENCHYNILCEALSNLITTYHIKSVFNHLADCALWYNEYKQLTNERQNKAEA